MYALFYFLYRKIVHSFHYRIRKDKQPLQDLLLKSGMNRWLDLGSSTVYTPGFYFSDITSLENIPNQMRDRYFQIDISKPMSLDEINKTGTYDFIRMQHVFEHFTPEDALIVLDNCYKLLNTNGLLLITVPDLEKYIRRYSRKIIHQDENFANWAKKRIDSNAPQSFYFSIFTHSVLYQPHLWCYDFEGLLYIIRKTGKFKNIRKINIFSSLASIPFTHNRPIEDLCVIIEKK